MYLENTISGLKLVYFFISFMLKYLAIGYPIHGIGDNLEKKRKICFCNFFS